MEFLETFCPIDDFCQPYEIAWRRHLLEGAERQRDRAGRLCLSEIVTILVGFHQSNFRTFKHFYLDLARNHGAEFPHLLSYQRFVSNMPSALVPLLAFVHSRCGQVSGISFIDSTSISVCKNKRIRRNKVFRDIAAVGKTTVGWFFGFKLHLVINDAGELLSFSMTPGNVDDRNQVSKLCAKLAGKLFGDKGYISKKLFTELWSKGIQLVTSHRSNMKNSLVDLFDKIMLRKRSIIETVNDQLKNISQIEHSRHRTLNNFFVNIVAGLAAYSLQPKKPHLNLAPSHAQLLFEATA
jgi:IS5 family transposase